jgi:molybdopterin synthase sulfur carrier subunit
MSTFATSGQPPTNGGGRPSGPPSCRVDLLLFARAREVAGTKHAAFDATTVGDVLDQARGRFGDGFAAVLDVSRVWVNGQPAVLGQPLSEGDEVAVLPPVSGG